MIFINHRKARKQTLRIGGLQKLTLLDFPGHTACTVFTDGCNFRCPFCHNSPLLDGSTGNNAIPEEALFALLEKRRGVLDGVAVTGGEPLLQPELPGFLRRIKAEGFLVKLDTNGSFPDRLAELLEEKLVDYVAMDVKNSMERYRDTCGTDRWNAAVLQSIVLLMRGSVPYEFRTTAVHELHTPEDFRRIGELIRGAPRYFIQCFKDSGHILMPGMTAPSREEMEGFLAEALPFVPNAQLRGI